MSFAYIWLLVLAVAAAACFYPSKKPAWLDSRIFLILLTGFVAQSLYLSSVQRQAKSGEPALDIDNAELVCKLNTAMDYVHDKFVDGVGSSLEGGKALGAKHLTQLEQPDFQADAVKLLEKQLDKAPDSVLTQAKLIVVLGEKGGRGDRRQLSLLTKTLMARNEPVSKQVGQALQAIYVVKVVDANRAHGYAAVLSKYFPPGWYRDSSLIRLYRVSGQTKLMESLKTKQADSCVGLMLNMLKLVVVAAIAGIFGLLVVLVQLLTLPRKLGQAQDEKDGAEAPPWKASTVYGVFVGWLATQIIISSVIQVVIKNTGMLTHGPFMASMATAVIYLACNVPGLFYIYYFACRPHQILFTKAVWLKLKSGNLGPVKLVLLGFCAWCAAIPIVTVASYIAMKYFGAQGSSNPVLTLVLDAARSSDWRATTIFYLTLGVLAPLCEETLFRGFLYRSLRKRLGVGTSLLASAALFAAVHLDSGAVIQLFCLGYVFGFVFERTRSLVPAMVAHGLWNSGTFTLVLMMLGS